MSRIEPKFKERWGEIVKKNYADQAKFFLNGFWDQGMKEEAETIYQLWQKFYIQDADKKKEGIDLDEFEAHKFLESLGETLTVIQLREKLRQIDLDNNNRMSFMEYMVFKYKKTVEQVVTAPQGDNRKEIEEAQARLQEAQNALAELQTRLEEQKNALAAQKKAEKEAHDAAESARASEASAKAAEAELKKAEEEVRKTHDAAKAAADEQKAALDELNKQETDYKNKIAALEAQSKDASATVVARNKAANELAQLKQEDPLPLRKAKITQEASLKKAEKTKKEAEAAVSAAKARTDEAKAARQEAERTLEAAKAARHEAERTLEAAKAARHEAERTLEAAKQRRLESEEATRQVEAATLDAEQKFNEANALLEEVKKKPGAFQGELWWMDREIQEAKKYLPKSKQK